MRFIRRVLEQELEQHFHFNAIAQRDLKTTIDIAQRRNFASLPITPQVSNICAFVFPFILYHSYNFSFFLIFF